MRRPLLPALAVTVATVLAACSGGDEDPVVMDLVPDDAGATTSSAPDDDAVRTTRPPVADDARLTTAPAPDPADVEGGEEGQAAADRAHEFLVAFVRNDPAACDLMVDYSGNGPMPASRSDLDACRESLAEDVGQDFDELTVALVESLRIHGADVQGDSAVVDADNLTGPTSEGWDDVRIRLTRFEDEWFVDITDSFTTG